MVFCEKNNIPHTIIVPNYNDAHRLSATLDSALRQTFTQFELVLVDDGSSDNSRQVIEEYAAKDGRIRPVFFTENKGSDHAVNSVLDSIQGTYFSVLAAGDYYSDNYLKAAHGCFSVHPQAVIWCCELELFRETTEIDLSQSIPVPKGVYYSKDNIIKVFKTTPFWIHGTATIIHKKTFLQYGGMPYFLGPQSDWFLFHSVALHEGICHSPAKLAFMELSDTSYSRKWHLDRNQRNAGYWKFLEYLYQHQNRSNRDKFIQSGLLTSISDTLFWKLIRQPRYWRLLKHSKSSTIKRFQHSFKKKFTTGIS